MDNTIEKKQTELIRVYENESYYPIMFDFHKHEHYELSVILSGNVNAFTERSSASGTAPKLVLSPPNTAHYINCFPDTLYKRANVSFLPDFISGDVESYTQLTNAFKKGGVVMEITSEDAVLLHSLILKIKVEPDLFRKKLILLYLISKINDLDKNKRQDLPEFIIKAINFVSEHYSEKITAKSLSWQIKVGRTTLLTSFKKYCGVTLNDYLLSVRIKNAVAMLQKGATEYETAVCCGFNEPSNLIRAFRRKFNLTPVKYLDELKKSR